MYSGRLFKLAYAYIANLADLRYVLQAANYCGVGRHKDREL